MMAYDSRSSPAPRHLSDTTLATLRDAVLVVWNDGGATDPAYPPALQEAVDRMVDEARARALRAEEVIVSLKTLLGALPELNASGRRLEAVRLRERLITLCIRAYYAE